MFQHTCAGIWYWHRIISGKPSCRVYLGCPHEVFLLQVSWCWSAGFEKSSATISLRVVGMLKLSVSLTLKIVFRMHSCCMVCLILLGRVLKSEVFICISRIKHCSKISDSCKVEKIDKLHSAVEWSWDGLTWSVPFLLSVFQSSRYFILYLYCCNLPLKPFFPQT